MKTIKECKGIAEKLYSLLSRHQRRNFILIFVLMIVCAALGQFTPKAIGWITDDILNADALDFSQILPLLCAILLISVFNQLLQISRRLLVEDMATQSAKRARILAISSLLRAPLSYFKKNMTGQIHGRLNRALEGTVQLEKIVFMDLAPAVFNSMAAILVIFTSLPFFLACLMMLVIPVGIFIVLRQIQTQKGIRVSLLEEKGAMDGSLVELLGGIEVVRMTNCENLEEERFARKGELIRSREMRHHKAMALYDFLKFFNECVFTVLTIGISAWLASQHKISVGAVLTSYLCFLQLLTPLQELHRILDELSENLILTRDFFQITDLPQDFSYFPEKPSRQKQENDGIVLQHVSLFYDDQKPVLDDLSVQIGRGTFIGMAGESGCGKSTFIKAVCRLEPFQGTIWLDQKDMAALSRKDIAQSITLIPQNPFLIAGTIEENICYGSRKTVSKEQMDWILEQACLKTFVDTLPEGIQSMVSEGGSNLSGGQKQRIALARIFLRQPEILILDEATSALDNTTERIIQKNIEALASRTGMTILAIAHRLSTLENCDEIFVMEKGRIADCGSFAELIKRDGLFHDMYFSRQT